MKHYHLYIRAGVQIDENTEFYKVAIGTSEREQRQCSWLESYAMEHGHLFMIWDAAAVGFLDRCFTSLLPLKRHYSVISAAALGFLLKTGNEDPATFYANLQRHRLLMQIDPHYYTQVQLKLKNH